MTNILSARLARLERQARGNNPLSCLSDEALEARISELNSLIEAEVGMPVADYAKVLSDSIATGEPLPEGMSVPEVQCFVAAIRNGKGINAHVR